MLKNQIILDSVLKDAFILEQFLMRDVLSHTYVRSVIMNGLKKIKDFGVSYSKKELKTYFCHLKQNEIFIFLCGINWLIAC